MSEGEFKKRMKELDEDIWNDKAKDKHEQCGVRAYYAMFLNVLDEAKKEFPHIERHGEETYSFQPFKFEAWFLKWFGDAK